MEFFSRVKNLFNPKAESSSATPAAIPDARTPEQFLELTKECEDRVQGMRNMDGSMPRLKINYRQCEYLAEKLKLAVQEAEVFLKHLQGSPISQGERTNCLNEFKLFYSVACAVENFIQICCKDAWVAAAFLMPNMAQDVLSLIYDLALLAYCFSGNHMTEVEGVYRNVTSVVKEKAANDRCLLLKNLKALLRTEEDTSAEYRLAELLLKRLETPGAYCTDVESLTEKKLIVKGDGTNLYKSKWLGIDVALKTFKAVKMDHGPSSPADFQAEVSIVGGLSHPNLASMFGYAEDKWECSILMELMDDDLSEWIRKIMQDRSREHPFSMIEAVNIMLEVGKGVEYLHEMKIVHQDLKAANILVKELGKWRDGESKSLLVKVADFGLSKTKEKSMTYSSQPANTGTARWMAPELIQMRRNVAQEEDSTDTEVLKYPRRSDVFSFGMVCYEIVTGRQPYFEVGFPNQVKKMILSGDRPELPEYCLPELKDLIKRCWSQEPSDRPRFDEICAKLRNIRFNLLFSATTPERLILELTKSCKDRVHGMLTRNVDGSLSRARVNDNQCKYLAEKLKLAVQEAEMFLTHPKGSSISQGEKTHLLNESKVLHSVACAVENFIQNCCKDAWVAAALLMPNVSQDVLSISFDLALLSNFFSGNFMMEVESVYRAETSVVTEKAASDRHLLLRNVKELLRISAKKTSAEYRLAELLVIRLETGRAYCIDIASLEEEYPLGEGGFADVYKSEWLGIDVAAKTFRKWPEIDVAAKTFRGTSSPGFQEEVSLLGRLSHPNVVSFFCYAEGERKCAIVMELMDDNLDRLIRKIMSRDLSRKHPFSILEAVNIMLQVGKGVEYLHDMKILHRNLRASNILVKELGNRGDGESKNMLVKVAGFGRAETIGENMTCKRGTARRWVAPEVIRMRHEGQEKVASDTKDSYSFGMLCYEILTGVKPYCEVESPNEVKKMILSGDRPELLEYCLPELKDLIKRCWSQEPSKQPRFDEICAKLRNIRSHLLFSETHRGVHD